MSKRIGNYIRQQHLALLALMLAVVGVPMAYALGKNTVGSKQIKPAAVNESDLADGAVTSPKVADGAVTSPKVADNTIGPDDLAAVPAFRGRVQTQFNVGPNSVTELPLQETLDNSEMHTNPSTDVTISRNGIYLLTAQVTIDGVSDNGIVSRQITVNNSGTPTAFEQDTDADADASLAAVTPLVAGDNVSLELRNQTASDMTVFSNNNHLALIYLGRAP